MDSLIAAVVSMIGQLIASGQEAKAQELRTEIARRYVDLPLPVLDKLVAQKLPPDAADRYTKATQATRAQGDVLDKTMEMVNERGETAEDRAAYLRMQNQAGGIANSANGAVERGMANRGLAGSGMAFALKQQGAQSAVNRANSTGIQAAADARGRYREALGMASSMASGMRSQEFAGLQAQDQINEFNARQQADADRYNGQLPQQQFDNQMTKLAGVSNATNQVANGYDRGAQNTRATAGGAANSIVTAGGYESSAGSKKKKKGEGYSNESGGQDWGDE